MRLKITREALLTPLQLISGVVEKKQTMPVLANVLLVADDDRLIITGTNMEVELVSLVDQVSISEEGELTVPARKLTDICKTLPDQSELELEVKESRLQVRSGRSLFTLSTLPAEHFPNVEEEAGSFTINITHGELKRLLDSTSFAMAQQDVRYYLNGLLLELSEDGVKAVATDGHRLAMSNSPQDIDIAEKKQFIVPRKGVLEFARLLDGEDEECTLIFGENHIRADLGKFIFTSKLIDGNFPDYKRVIPRGGDKYMYADRQELKSVFLRTSILSHESIRGVRLQFEPDLLRVFANNPEQEEAEDSIAVEYNHESLQIGFNVGYLIDVLNVLKSDTVKFTLANANSSVLIESDEDPHSLYVVMPMRL